MGRWRTRGVLLLTALIGTSVVPLRGQAATDQKPLAFDVVSVKPNTSGDVSVSMAPSPGGITITNYTLQFIVRVAYKVQDWQIIGGPSWLTTDRFDVAARTSTGQLPIGLQPMLQSFLRDRFRLVAHTETRQLPIYLLVRARKNGALGSHLKIPSDCTPPLPQRDPPAHSTPTCTNEVRPGALLSRGVTTLGLAVNLSPFLDRTVVDRTGISGLIDYDLSWTPELARDQNAGERPQTNANGPSLFTALQEQLGLKLESTRGPVEVLVIDHVERPTPD
jgi:uncharacterized protein (TIGR03435 family)